MQGRPSMAHHSGSISPFARVTTEGDGENRADGHLFDESISVVGDVGKKERI